MGKVKIAKNLIKTTVFIDKSGNRIETSGKDRFKQMQELRAQKLGLSKKI